MVVDTLDNLEKYVSLNPLFADVVKFIKDNDLSKLEDGKHFIKEGNLFVNITTAHGKSEEDAVFETHRKMRKHETAVCGTARTVVWEVGKCENRRQMPFMISIYLLPDYLYGLLPILFSYLLSLSNRKLFFCISYATRGKRSFDILA